MTEARPNPKDLEIWNGLFAEVPSEWRTAPPSTAMHVCAGWLREVGARTVLDVGCGVGRWTVWLQQEGFETAGADFAPNGIDYARAWAADESLSIPFVCVPITERPFPERRFDAVVAALVLDLVSPVEFDIALDVIRGSLRMEGCLFAVFNPLVPPTEEEAKGNPTADVTHTTYADDELIDRLELGGFRLLRRQDRDLDTRGFLWQC